jgi:hypothetical protein
MTEAYLEVLDLGYFEAPFAFEGLADENVWKRPAEGLLSVGELAGHIAYWLAARLAGGGPRPDWEKCPIKSLLLDDRFRYYTGTLETAPSEEHLAMTAQQVSDELVRVYQESVARFKALEPDPKSVIPGWEDGNTYDEAIKYSAFHVSYHTGQMYSVRHLLGDTTTDN